MNRRQFLAASGAVILPQLAAGQLVAPPASDKKIACIATTYHRYSHADNIITRFMEGYSIIGKSFPPPCKVASLYIEQIGDTDIGRPLARQWKIPLVSTVADALTLGTDKLAVDGVVIVAEHGDYPTNDRGQKMYPRRRIFEEVVKVFRASKRSVPVFNDKHLAYSWTDAKWMYDQSKELGFPMMAGSSVPVTHRHPDLRPRDVEWESALSVGYGHFEIYGFHTLEALQVMTENRKGGETGVKAVQCLAGKEAWEAAKSGRWDRALLDAAVKAVFARSKPLTPAPLPQGARGKMQDDDAEALVYLIEYNDGLKAAAYLSPRHVQEFAFAGRMKGKTQPDACWYELPKPQRDHFSFLTGHIAQMIQTGKATYPVERTLLTAGMLDFLMTSRASGNKRVETSALNVKYQV
jgi:hypothetical protein